MIEKNMKNYENSQLFAKCVVSGLVGIMSTSLFLSFVVKDLLLGALGPSPAAHVFGATSAKNSCGVCWQSTSLSLSFVVKDLLLDAPGPSTAVHAVGAAASKNACRVGTLDN